jgi:hypothetical protein
MLDAPGQAARSLRLAALRQGARATLAQIMADFPEEAEAIAGWRDGLPVAFVMGSARGGTSAFKALIARHPRVLAMAGEHRPFFTLCGQNYPDSGEGAEAARLPPDPESCNLIRDLILACAFAGPEVARPDAREVRRYALDWALRLPLQWTGHDIEAEQVIACVTAAAMAYLGQGDDDLALLDQRVLAALRRRFPFVDPAFYDGQRPGRRGFAALRADMTPIVEITPFVLPRPRQLKRPGSDVDLLLLKASSDAFRLPALRAVFPRAGRQMLRLTRNPLASINGLLDGWAYGGFWQHDLTGLPGLTEGLAGWCFDLVPNWRDWAQRGSLPAIAAEQWIEPNRLMQMAEATAPAGERWTGFRFEAFQAGGGARRDLAQAAARALGLDPDDPAFAAAIAAPPRINATARPAAARWRAARPELASLLQDSPRLAQLAQDLGYKRDTHDAWI